MVDWTHILHHALFKPQKNKSPGTYKHSVCEWSYSKQQSQAAINFNSMNLTLNLLGLSQKRYHSLEGMSLMGQVPHN